MGTNPQLNAKGELTHLLTLEGLPREIIIQILDTATSFVGVTEREVKKVPLLRGISVFNLFFESSTRTRTRPRGCSTPTRSGTTRRTSAPCRSRSSATSCTRVSRDRSSTL
jgi:hypothetical protein